MRISCKSLAADAFSNAAHCALMTASEGNVQAAKDNFQIRLLETRAAYVAAAGAATAKAKAVAFKAKAAEDSSKAKQLEQKARIAKTKAELFLSKCKSAAAIGEKASETSQSTMLRMTPKPAAARNGGIASRLPFGRARAAVPEQHR